MSASDLVGLGRDRPAPATSLRVTVVQDGSRLHYGLPRALKRAGILGTMHADWFVRSRSLQGVGAALMARLGGTTGRRLAARRCAELDGSRVVAAGWPTLLARLREDRTTLPERIFVQRSRAMTRQVLADGWRGSQALVGFVRNIDPALCEAARRNGVSVVLDQMIAPIDVEMREEQRQAELWPEWRGEPGPGAAIMRAVEQRSWAAASHITCASDYVRDGLLAAGMRPGQISVIPYPVDASSYAPCDRRRRKGPVVVGFVGAVSLRKGAPAFFEVARAFDPARVRFVMVGPVVADRSLLERRRGAVDVVGSVPRGEVRAWLASFDLFLFPSSCEGSAGAVMEAMATGLPIVTTPNSGALVRHGEDGFVVSCEDVAGMVRYVDRLVQGEDLRLRMGLAARRRVETQTISRYGEAWRELLTGLIDPGGDAGWRR